MRYTPPAGTVLPVARQTLSTVFTPSDTADYITAAAAVQIVVNPIACAGCLDKQRQLGQPQSPDSRGAAGT